MKLHMLCVRLSCAGVILRSVLVAVLLVGGVSLSSAMTTHYIIAFDLCLPDVYNRIYERDSILSEVDGVLSGNFNSATDYVSVVGYSLFYRTPSMEHFVRPYSDDNGDKVLWYKKGDKTLSQIFSSSWPPERGENGGSLQSLAKRYVVLATRNDSLYADRTIILLVTDLKNNGTDDDYSEEWRNLHSVAPPSVQKCMDEEKDDVINTADIFNENFHLKELRNSSFRRETLGTGGEKPYVIVPYELTASDRLSMYGCTDLPSSLPLRRVRGGYRVNMEIRPTDDAHSLRELLLTCGSDTLFLSTAAAGEVMRINELINELTPSKSLSGVDSLTISATVAYDDGQYNGCLLSYRNPTYRKGMSRTWKWEPPSEEKIFGRLPLWDIFWWWYPNDVVKAVMVWDGIFVLLFLIIVVWLFYRCFEWINAYTPKDKNIKITKIE